MLNESEQENQLVWTPTYQYVAEKIREQKKLLFVIAPFIKRDALKRLLDECEDVSQLQVITRWDSDYLVKGVTDVEIYEDLEERDVPLYHHPHIHLKLLVFNENWAFHSSGNVTLNGLGLSARPNIEVGAQTRLRVTDWVEIYKVFEGATRVDDDLYEKACRYKEENESPVEPLPPLALKTEEDKAFSRLSLPAVQSPEKLFEIHENPEAFREEEDVLGAYIHDVALYDVPSGQSREDFFKQLEANFKSQPFIQAISEFVREKRSVHFGGMNEWISNHCSDNPTPRRWEIKPTTKRLYDWLAFFYDEITWDVPGSHSQVIYWND